MKNSAPSNLTPVKRSGVPKLDAKQIEKRRQKDKEMVRGVFKDYEVPGGELEFSFGPIYKGDETITFSRLNGTSLKDGEVYTIPFGVAKHLNNNCNYPEFEHQPGEGFAGAPNAYTRENVRISKKVHRFGFNTLDFMQDEDLAPAPTIYAVENAL